MFMRVVMTEYFLHITCLL